MRVATWNVNGIRAREANVLRWLDRQKPDLLLMQEIKCEAANFPKSIAEAGYHPHLVGQKGFNGVGILSREPLEITCTSLPGLPEDDAQARYVEVDYPGRPRRQPLPSQRQLKRRHRLPIQAPLDGLPRRTRPIPPRRRHSPSSSQATTTSARKTLIMHKACSAPTTPWSAPRPAHATGN